MLVIAAAANRENQRGIASRPSCCAVSQIPTRTFVSMPSRSSKRCCLRERSRWQLQQQQRRREGVQRRPLLLPQLQKMYLRNNNPHNLDQRRMKIPPRTGFGSTGVEVELEGEVVVAVGWGRREVMAASCGKTLSRSTCSGHWTTLTTASERWRARATLACWTPTGRRSLIGSEIVASTECLPLRGTGPPVGRGCVMMGFFCDSALWCVYFLFFENALLVDDFLGRILFP